MEITILTLDTGKARNNSPSLTGMVTLIDLHMPDVFLLTETPMMPHHGAQTQVLRSRGYKIH
jgi:hypothetical protein